ncbi:MAG: tagaturonate reductase [Fusobacteriaceae bacterium]
MILNRGNFQGMKKYSERVVQFGEGNFLRCFIDWQLDILNEKKGLDAGITVVRPIDTKFPPSLSTQDGLYTTIIRGIDEEGKLIDNKRIISSVNRELNVYTEYSKVIETFLNPDLEFVFSNTTEAGIVFNSEDKYQMEPQVSFPGKLTKFLHMRYKYFKGDATKGLIIIPCELIDYNGEELKKIVFQYCELWNLEIEFINWLENRNTWCSSLVDRIVTGYPRDEKETLEKELGYQDKFMVAGEYFHLFVIQGPKWLEDKLSIKDSGLNIKVVEDIKSYKERKVGILNGAHTALVPVSYLCGIDRVRESLDDDYIRKFLENLIGEEIIPSLDMDKKELEEFADSVIKRFSNPFVKHELLSISLNSMFKFKTRILPQMITYIEEKKKLPKHMVFSLAALVVFYRGKRENQMIPLNDEQRFLDIYKNLWDSYDGTLEVAKKIACAIASLDHWGYKLNEVPGFVEKLATDIYRIEKKGVRTILEKGEL